MTTSRAESRQAGPGAPHPGRRRRRRWIWPAAGVTAVVVAATLVWFQPQKLLYDHRVDESLPGAAPSVPATGSAGPAAAAPTTTVLAEGTFVSREHATRGTARLLRLADGRTVVRFEDFAT